MSENGAARSLTALTNRRAMEHPPQLEFYWRRGFALTVVDTTSHLCTASLGDEGVDEEALL